MSGLKARLISGLTLGAICVFLALAGGWFIFIPLLSLCLVAAREFLHMSRLRGLSPIRWICYSFIVIFLSVVFFFNEPEKFTTPLIIILILFSFLIQTWRNPRRKNFNLQDLSVTIFISVYTAGLMSHILLLDRLDEVRLATPELHLLPLIPVFMAWCFDSGGYFAGKLFGRIKLAPGISPKKTVEGVVGGVICSGAGMVMMTLICEDLARLTPHWKAFTFGVVLGIAAQLGDLAMSLVKRDFDVSDTSKVIPGHGGLLDRMDSIFFTSFTAYYLYLLFTPAGAGPSSQPLM